MSTAAKRRRYSAVTLLGNFSTGRYTAGNNQHFRERAIASIGIAQEKNRKPVINTETGEIYKSVTEAAEKTGLSVPTISQVCRKVGKFEDSKLPYSWYEKT